MQPTTETDAVVVDFLDFMFHDTSYQRNAISFHDTTNSATFMRIVGAFCTDMGYPGYCDPPDRFGGNTFALPHLACILRAKYRSMGDQWLSIYVMPRYPTQDAIAQFIFRRKLFLLNDLLTNEEA